MMQPVPQNAAYYHAAYVAALAIYAAYALSLRIRGNRAVERLRTLTAHRESGTTERAP
ncbi:MAG TPA: hypothetical protein VFK13_09430 [Gemmatimonadaceae bacterium]|nr:hypothetical protein [Gemmatimonadaceae bacterium]